MSHQQLTFLFTVSSIAKAKYTNKQGGPDSFAAPRLFKLNKYPDNKLTILPINGPKGPSMVKNLPRSTCVTSVPIH